MFKVVSLRDKYKCEQNLEEGKESKPYLIALVDEQKCEDPDIMAYRILNVHLSDPEQTYNNRTPEFGDYVTAELSEVRSLNSDIHGEDLEDARYYDRKFQEYHKDAPYVIRGRFYSEKTYGDWDQDKEFPECKELDSRIFYPGKNVDSLDKAAVWMLENHPDYYMGCTIVQECRGGNMLGDCPPLKGTRTDKDYETWEGRRKICERELAELYDKIRTPEKERKHIGNPEHDKNGNRFKTEKEVQNFREEPEQNNRPKLRENFFTIWRCAIANPVSRMDTEYLKKLGIDDINKLIKTDYEPVYTAPYDKERSIEELYKSLQNESPDVPGDFELSSLTTGDILQINKDGQNQCYFRDKDDFKEIEGFTRQIEQEKEKERYLINGVIHNRTAMTKLETEIFEDQYGTDIDGDEKIGINEVAEDIEDRDLNGTGLADKYDKNPDIPNTHRPAPANAKNKDEDELER